MTLPDANDLLAKLNAISTLTDTEKAYLRDQLTSRKKYGLIWEDKPEAVEQQLQEHLPVLTEVSERYVVNKATNTTSVGVVGSNGSGRPPATPTGQTTLLFASEKSASLGDYHQSPNEADFSESISAPAPRSVRTQTETDGQSPAPIQNHTLIEGDNLHALTVLNYTHAGAVDVIYIDPPYNTGNKDFKYNDTFVDREDAYRHSKWLSFMAKRLRLARTLLKDTGVIFISIDDNEQAQLKLLCDEVFGEENMQAKFVWRTDGNFDNQAKVKVCHEYVYCFCKNITQFKVSPVIDSSVGTDSKLFKDEIQNTIVKNGPKNPVSRVKLPAGFPALFQTGVVRERTNKFPFYHNDALVEEYQLVNEVEIESGWASKSLLEEFINSGFKPVIDTKGQETVFKISDSGSVEVIKVRANQSHIISVLSGLGNTQSTSNFLAGMGVKFTYPKPINLVKYLVELSAPKNALVLDFFAGSGTTLHAVMALNAEDGGSRRCILVTNNENGIAEEVCYERNRRVIAGYTNAKGQAVPGLPGNALRYYRTALAGRERTLANKRALMQQATDLLYLKEGIYVETRHIASPDRMAYDRMVLPETANAQEADAQETPGVSSLRLFADTNRAMLVVYDPDAIDEAVALIGQLPATSGPVKVYVFAPASYPFTEDFAEVADRIELCALPDAIYQAYEQAFRALNP